MWLLWGPDPALHLFFHHCHPLPEAHPGSADGSHSHPHARAAGGPPEAARHTPGGDIVRGAVAGGGGK